MVSTIEEQAAPIRYQLKRHKPRNPLFDQYGEEVAKTPSQWFSLKFPEQARRYGPPILEGVQGGLDQTERISAVALNEDFFAAILGGDSKLGHHVVFYLPEQLFYFYDCRFGYYAQTTEDKLMTLLSQYLIQCSADMPETVDTWNMFCDLRHPDNLKRIIKRARSMLAADQSFFQGSQGHKRKLGDQIIDPTAVPAYALFIKEAVEPKSNEFLTVHTAYDNFTRFCDAKGLTPVERKHFKSLIAEVIKEEFGMGVRRDIKDAEGKYLTGWKGLSCRPLVGAEMGRN